MITIIHEGDYHCGHLLGLTPPDVPSPMADAVRHMWAWREAELKAVGPVDLHILNGDLVDGPGFKGALGLLTADLDEQAAMAETCAARVKIKKGGERHCTYGSDFHVVAFGNTERRIAKALGASIQDTLLLKASGIRFNFRHFVGRSDTERGQLNQAGREITRALIQELTTGGEAADVYGRSHVHYWSRADLDDRIAYTCPCYELPLDIPGSTYPRRLRTQYYHVGYTLLQIDRAGELFIRKRIMPLNIEFPKEYKRYAPINAEA